MPVDASKDYYAVLGVLPSIDPVALKAVYLALLKKYHPDVFKGSKSEAERITKELNEAYEVLGNQEKRSYYDAARKNQSTQSGDFSQGLSEEDLSAPDKDLEQDWNFIIDYHPAAEARRKELLKISSSLAFMFQIILLTKKLAKDSYKISDELRFEYLSRYFGKNIDIHNFVVSLLDLKRKDAALEINNYVRLMGEPSEQEVNKFKQKIIKKYNIKNLEENEIKPSSESYSVMIYIVLFIMLFAIILISFSFKR